MPHDHTGANITIIRSDLAHRLGEKLIWTPPCITLQTVTGDKINVHGKVHLNIAFGDAIYHHVAFVADISDQFILGLDFLRENTFKLDFKNNELHSSTEDTAVFKMKCEGNKTVHQVTAKCAATIPLRSEMIVQGIVNKDNNFHYTLIEYPRTDNRFKGILVAYFLSPQPFKKCGNSESYKCG